MVLLFLNGMWLKKKQYCITIKNTSTTVYQLQVFPILTSLSSSAIIDYYHAFSSRITFLFMMIGVNVFLNLFSNLWL